MVRGKVEYVSSVLEEFFLLALFAFLFELVGFLFALEFSFFARKTAFAHGVSFVHLNLFILYLFKFEALRAE